MCTWVFGCYGGQLLQLPAVHWSMTGIRCHPRHTVPLHWCQLYMQAWVCEAECTHLEPARRARLTHIHSLDTWQSRAARLPSIGVTPFAHIISIHLSKAAWALGSIHLHRDQDGCCLIWIILRLINAAIGVDDALRALAICLSLALRIVGLLVYLIICLIPVFVAFTGMVGGVQPL